MLAKKKTTQYFFPENALFSRRTFNLIFFSFLFLKIKDIGKTKHRLDEKY
jgi:hypothetical protein